MERIYKGLPHPEGGEIEIKAAGVDMLKELISLEDRSIDPKIFCRITEEEFLESIERDTVLTAWYRGSMIALAVIMDNRESARSLAGDIGESADSVLTFDGVIVAPEARGLGLQRHFLALAEGRARELGAAFVVATVSEGNAPSRRNFARSGFAELFSRPKYGSTRIIVAKRLS